MSNNTPRHDTQIATYATRLRARTDPRHPCNQSFGYKPPNLPEEYRDRIAEKEFQQKLTGGFKKHNKDGSSNVCETCFMARSANESCNCR